MAAAGDSKLPAAAMPAAESSDSEDDVESVQYKVILLGDGAVGKSSLCQRFASDDFGKVYKQTIGVDFFLKRIELPGPTMVTLQVWDIGGQTIGGKMLRNYIYGAHAVLLTYDITNTASFANLEDWLREAQATFGVTASVGAASGSATEAAGAAAPAAAVVAASVAAGSASSSPTPTHAAKEGMPYLALVGNKTDLGHLRTIKPQKHKDFGDAHAMHSYFVSAKTGDNVAAMFYRVAADLAGVVMTKPDLQIASKVIRAEIVNHQQHDPSVEAPRVGARSSSKGRCSVQ